MASPQVQAQPIPAKRVWGARITRTSQTYENFTLGKRLGSTGASGAVFELAPPSTPQLVGKLYHARNLPKLRTDPDATNRLLVLANETDTLTKDLPFAAWPRHILFESKDTAKGMASLLGFSMQRLIGTKPLEDLVMMQQARFKLTPAKTAFIAITLADHLSRLHRHKRKFVMGDISLRNFHISSDLNSVYLIDTDSFQFDDPEFNRTFRTPGMTPGYKSPGAQKLLESKKPLPPQHDDFVLAILIFQLLMADRGFPTHPFMSGGDAEDLRIEKRQFPISSAGQFPVSPHAITAWNNIPQKIRDHLQATFTGKTIISADEWVKILSDYRRLL